MIDIGVHYPVKCARIAKNHCQGIICSQLSMHSIYSDAYVYTLWKLEFGDAGRMPLQRIKEKLIDVGFVLQTVQRSFIIINVK